MLIIMTVRICLIIMLYYHFSFLMYAPKTISMNESLCCSLSFFISSIFCGMNHRQGTTRYEITNLYHTAVPRYKPSLHQRQGLEADQADLETIRSTSKTSPSVRCSTFHLGTSPHGQGMQIYFLTMRNRRLNIKHPILKYFSEHHCAVARGDGEGAPRKLALA